MRYPLFLLAAVTGLMLAGSPAHADETSAASATPVAAEAQAPVFTVYDHVVLHMEFNDNDMSALQEVTEIVEQVLREAKLPEDSEEWQEEQHFTLTADSKIVEPPITVALTIKPFSTNTEPKNQQAQQTFYYDPAEALQFTSALRIYFRDTLQVIFTEKAPETPTSALEMVDLKLKGTNKEMAILNKMANLVRMVLKDAEPLLEAYDDIGELKPRQLELRLNAEIAEPPFEALFALENVDIPDEIQRQTQVFSYNPDDVQTVLDELRDYLGKVLYVEFPPLEVEAVPPTVTQAEQTDPTDPDAHQVENLVQ